MSDQPSKIEALEQTIGKLQDLQKTYISLVEKMARVQAEAMAAGQDSIANQLSKPFASASNNAKLLEAVVHDAEMERNKLKAES